MIALILSFFARYKMILTASVALFIFLAGMRTQALIYRAHEARGLKETLSIERKAADEQFKHDLRVEKARQLIDKMNDKLTQDLETTIVKSPVPKCDISSDRIVLINRAASRQ